MLYIEGRQFPVTTYYTEEPEADYLDATLLSIFQIHLEKPPGSFFSFAHNHTFTDLQFS